MSKIWYDHLVLHEEVTVELDRYKLAPEEKTEIVNLIDQVLHHHVLNVILSHLPKEHHQAFISDFIQDPGSTKLLEFVKSRVTVDIESEIKKQADRIKKDILRDIQKSKSKK